MKRSLLLAAALIVMTAAAADAQMRRPAPTPRTWASGYGLMYTGMSGFHDPGTGSDWVFDDNAFGFGVDLHREITPGLLLGADLSLGRPRYARRVANTQSTIATGTATIGTAMVNGRFSYGGMPELGFYLTGGIGTIAYYLEDLEDWNADFALRAGTGIEYRFAGRQSIFLEWGRIWGYHEREGVGGGAAQHSVLKLGLRFGF
jgi:opacity protein-like surface antigen